MRQQDFHQTRWIEGLLTLLLLVGASGCGKQATISGKVTYQGRPVTYGSVIFLGGDGRAWSAAVARDGSYKIEGASPGMFKIGVISPDPSTGRSAARRRKPESKERAAGSPDAPVTAWFPLPTQFETPSTSGLECSVGSGLVNHDIELR